ncbi:MAG TPA: TIGR02757 family protein, partial [Bacteroidales bacterium]|nr:TIGR02757 family protein [Bacteroidales bacterium]
MFLRWMVRNDGKGVDFGIWKKIDPSMLFIPIDFHSGNTARKLGLLKRKMNDWKAVEELTGVLREFDPADPVKYDFALFGWVSHRRFKPLQFILPYS